MQELSINLNESEKVLVKKNIRNLLTALDKRYLTFVGEIAVLNNLIKSKIYRLGEVEYPLPNDKTIDFKLRKISDNTSMLVEIDNIFLDGSKVENDDKKIKKFLTDRLSQKIESKKNGLIKDIDFYLVPAIWGSWKDIEVYSKYFESNKMHIQNVVEPASFLTFTDPNNDNYYLHRFGNISNLFKNE